MKKKTYILVGGLVLILTITCGVIITRPEPPRCDIRSLVLGQEEIFKGWHRDEELYPAFLPMQDRLGAQQAYHNFMVENDKEIGHTVYQYSNKWLAIFHLWFDEEIFFPSVGWEWSEFKNANDLPLHADQTQIQCGSSNLQYLGDGCTALLRYGPYISDFRASTPKGGISTEEFKEIIIKIDESFSLCEK